jgi:hypothetical protein
MIRLHFRQPVTVVYYFEGIAGSFNTQFIIKIHLVYFGLCKYIFFVICLLMETQHIIEKAKTQKVVYISNKTPISQSECSIIFSLLDAHSNFCSSPKRCSTHFRWKKFHFRPFSLSKVIFCYSRLY